MRIVNRRRFTIACLVFAILLGLSGYGVYRGGVWVYKLISSSFEEEEAEIKFGDERVVQVSYSLPGVQKSLVEQLEWISRFVIGCNSDVLYQEGIASLTFEVIPEFSLSYYPPQEIRSRLLKQSLKVVRDISKTDNQDEIKQLNLLYVDQRFTTNENPLGEVMQLTFSGEEIYSTDWERKSWPELEAYMVK